MYQVYDDLWCTYNLQLRYFLVSAEHASKTSNLFYLCLIVQFELCFWRVIFIDARTRVRARCTLCGRCLNDVCYCDGNVFMMELFISEVRCVEQTGAGNKWLSGELLSYSCLVHCCSSHERGTPQASVPSLTSHGLIITTACVNSHQRFA